jgi:hypothetical protein
MVFLKKKIFGKKGAELTLNTVIISILVLLVLVVVVGMFLGGTSQLKDFASKILRQNVAGTDIDLAIGQCNQWCVQAKDRPKNSEGIFTATPPYCKQTFNLDIDGDGTAEYLEGNKESGYAKYSCWETPLNVLCSDVQDSCPH